MMQIRNARFTADGRIDLEFSRDGGATWRPYLAQATGDLPLSHALHALALQGDVAPYVEPAPPPLTPTDVRAECARRMSAIVAGYTTEERETWPVQIAEARAVVAGATEAPMLAALAAARGLPLAAFANAVLQVTAATTAATAALLAAQARLLAMHPIPADFADDKWWA